MKMILISMMAAAGAVDCGGRGAEPMADTGIPAVDGGIPVDDGGADGPFVHIHLRVVGDPVEHLPATVGQTPALYAGGMRRFTLRRSVDDRAPMVVFDNGDGFVEAGHLPGDDTIVASVPISGLTAGYFTVGSVVYTHARFEIGATMHASGITLPGRLEQIVAMSDRATLDGRVRSRGYYGAIFRAAGMEFPAEGMVDVPVLPSGGFGVSVVDGEHTYTFPVDLPVDPGFGTDVHMVMEVNMHEPFRWEDEDMPGYAAGVFDMTPVGTEPLRQFGANDFRVYMDPMP